MAALPHVKKNETAVVNKTLPTINIQQQTQTEQEEDEQETENIIYRSRWHLNKRTSR